MFTISIESQGLMSVREEVASFLKDRDGYPANVDDIFITNGASEGVRYCFTTFLRDPSTGFKEGILTPLPQYPLYSALTTLLNGYLVPYLLDESNSWSCSADVLTESLEKAKKAGISTRALVVINPGNPTGQVLDIKTMQEIVQWCVKNDICLMADEVYQENIWKKDSKFVSFRKIAYDMNVINVNGDGEKGLQMVSFHSVSKVRPIFHHS